VPDRVTLAVGKLDHTDPTVRQAAAEVLGANLNPSVVAPLVAQLPTEYRPLYLATRAALIAAKDEPTRQACIMAAGALLHDANPRRQEDGSYILGRYRSAHELERHIVLLAHESVDTDWALVRQAVESLGLIGRQEARKPIASIVMQGEALVARGGVAALDTAFIAAGRLGATEILPACGGVLATLDPMRADFQRRQAAVFAIGACGTEQSPEVKYVYTVLGSQMDAKDEAIKAIGNLKLRDGPARLEQGFPMAEAAVNRWMVQWAVARIKGEPAQHPPATYPWTATTTSYKDLSGK
jgi:HEAT repeat protein